MLEISHISFSVSNLHSAAKEIENMGFKIEWGGPKGKENNFFIWFGENAFLEVFSIKRRHMPLFFIIHIIYGKVVAKRWWKWFSTKNKFVDFALEDSDDTKTIIRNYKNKIIVDIELIKENLKESKIDFSRTMHWKRTNKEGIKANYSYFVPYNENLPFIVSKYEPLQKPKKNVHPNGAKLIKNIRLFVKKSEYRDMNILTKDANNVIIEEGNSTTMKEIEIYGLEKECYFCDVKFVPA